MKNKIIFSMIVIFILMVILFANVSSVQAVSLAGPIDSAQEFTNHGKSEIVNYKNLYNVINYLYNIAMIIAIIFAIIVGIILGIRIIFGTIDEKADSKHLLVPYLVIVGVIAFGFTIWKVALSMLYKYI